jgi:hypothetical protein
MTLKGKDFSLAHPVAQSTKVTQLSTILGRYVPGGRVKRMDSILLGAPSMVSACKLSETETVVCKKWEPRAPKKDGSLRLSPFVFV